MSSRRMARVVGAAIAAWVLVMPRSVYPCGPWFQVPMFVSPRPLEKASFAAGKLGILLPSYSADDLVVAWRVLHGQPLTSVEKEAYFAPPKPVVFTVSDPVQRWLQLQATVTGDKENFIAVEAQLRDYQFFVNCTDDAFRAAADRLEALIGHYGRTGSEVLAWTEAQKQVFSNCSQQTVPVNKPAATPTNAGAAAQNAAMTIPPALPQTAPAVLRADRDYQIAAANFYATNFDTAAQQFAAVARDADSPWRQYGLLLAARSWLRKGTMGPLLATGKGDEFDRDALMHADEVLQQVLADPGLAAVHPSARRLRMMIALRLHPEEERLRLSAELSMPSDDANFSQKMHDYLYLLQKAAAQPLSDGAAASPCSDLKGDELGEWMVGMWHPQENRAIAEQRWSSGHSEAWLLVTLAGAKGDEANANGLVRAAFAVPASSPAYAMAQYHAARLLGENNQRAQAREALDRFLNSPPVGLPLSAQNAFRGLRAAMAVDLDDFAKFAIKPPVDVGYDAGGGVEGSGGSCAQSGKCPKWVIDGPAADVLNRLPLEMLVRVGADAQARPELRHEALVVAWERGALLEDWQAADEAAEELGKMTLEDARDLGDYRQSRSAEERKFTAALLMLKWPGGKPWIESGVLRDEGIRKLDNYRMNWWCGNARPLHFSVDEMGKEAPASGVGPQFLDAQQEAAAQAELARLDKVGPAPNVLAPAVIEWARLHKEDGRVPEALHLAVRATRYGCEAAPAPAAQETSRYSKAAFELLHRNYPHSIWAKKTPYYF